MSIWYWVAWMRDKTPAERKAFLDECSALYEETRPKTAREQLLETHLRRLLEAGMKLRWSDATDPWDQAASDAEGVLRK